MREKRKMEKNRKKIHALSLSVLGASGQRNTRVTIETTPLLLGEKGGASQLDTTTTLSSDAFEPMPEEAPFFVVSAGNRISAHNYAK
jgi:hypothetical protein